MRCVNCTFTRPLGQPVKAMPPKYPYERAYLPVNRVEDSCI
ncbi:hypothetical protein J2Z17_000713 [Rhizobium halophytocola]|uniref:Uncharacterized protein n=1 Tax=Rhizobium halophytocola TaxID=735519 RepID=A0ABS4DUE5_9HYPH|nr:hypothetical protein [Rhizobium halophytocola]